MLRVTSALIAGFLLALMLIVSAQPFSGGTYKPTMEEPPPGVDNTARDVELGLPRSSGPVGMLV